MKFIFKIDTEKIEGDPAAEIGRALRYWGSATKQLDFAKEQRIDIMDSSYKKPIGYWELRAEDEHDIAGHQHDDL